MPLESEGGSQQELENLVGSKELKEELQCCLLKIKYIFYFIYF